METDSRPYLRCRHRKGRRYLRCYRIDCTGGRVFRGNVDCARAAVMILENAIAAARVVNLLHARFLNLNIYLRARDKAHKLCLTEASASGIVNGSCELSIFLGGAVLRDCSTPDEQIRQIVRDHRAED